MCAPQSRFRGGREQLTPIAAYSRVLPRQCYRTGLQQAGGVALGFGQAQPRLEPSGAWSLSCPATSNKTSRVIGSTQRAAERCGDRFLTHLASAWADSRSILPRRGFPWAKHGLWHVAHAIGHQGKASLACPRARRAGTSRLGDGGDITNLRVRNPKSVPTRKGGCMTPTIRATCSNATGAT